MCSSGGTAAQFTREKEEREHRDTGQIRTGTDMVAKVISQKEIGPQSISVSSRGDNLLGPLKVNNPRFGSLTPAATDS